MERTITVSGTGRAAATPDAADVVLGVEVVRPTARAAREAAAATMARVVAAIRERGLADADIGTSDLSLSAELEYQPDRAPRRVGYRLGNRVTMRVRRIEDVATLVDAAIEAGATTLDGIAFRVADPSPLEAAALAAAVDDARARGESLATAAAERLGAVRSIQEVAAGTPPGPEPRFALMEAKAADTPVLPGTTEITARVVVVFDLERAG